MAYDHNWPRWVQSSVANHFKTVANSEGYASLVEELEERTTAFQEAENRCEIRVDGPHITEVSAGDYRFKVDTYIMIFSHMGDAADNAYAGTEIAGKMAEASANIPILKHGLGVEDDGSTIGCLRYTSSSDGGVKVHHFGEINREDRLRQLAVTCSYIMYASN